jgi:hypothetical protein
LLAASAYKYVKFAGWCGQWVSDSRKKGGAMKQLFLCLAVSLGSLSAFADEIFEVTGVEAQPLAAQTGRLQQALRNLGTPLKQADAEKLNALTSGTLTAETSSAIQKILDPYCIAMVDINPEARVKVLTAAAKPELTQMGWKTFLVKVHNAAPVTAELKVDSPNTEPIFHASSSQPIPLEKNAISKGQLAERWVKFEMYNARPMTRSLSGLALEYRILQVYTKETGQREASLSFNVGQGSQDIGYRNAINILFTIKPSTKLVLRVKDDNGKPTTGSFIILDQIERFVEEPGTKTNAPDYRDEKARSRSWQEARLAGIYPNPGRRLADGDEYPDFFFHPQVYRSDGEHVVLPAGTYEITYGRGPEYITEKRTVTIPEGVDQVEEKFQLKRWVNMAKLGWYSQDHHVHAGGCSHYESPEAGVKPESMMRQSLGEDLNIACVLTWGPCWYHQKSFFEGKVHALSTKSNLLRYDVEVSGFPSSHAGHICLIKLTEDDYPGTTKIEEWPSWTLPVLQWAKSQGGLVGYAHSGWGLEPVAATEKLPNYVMPKFDGIGANEYIVTVVHGACDFISAGDTPINWEMNIWYHTLNCGYRARISGETDFPCIFDEKVGMGRSYAKQKKLDFDSYQERVREGASYVSDGKSHIIDFKVDKTELGKNGPDLKLSSPKSVKVTAKVCAYLPEQQDAVGAFISKLGFNAQPYWDVERARIGSSRNVAVEIVMNGYAVGRQEIIADGAWHKVSFDVPVENSSWLAMRVLGTSHTNPIFATVADKPIRASKRSAEWCRRAVDACWEKKMPQIREAERSAAIAAYDVARSAYDKAIAESVAE